MYGTAATITAHPSLRQQTILLEREMCLNDQGGMRMGVSEGVSGTLRADMGGHPPICLLYTSHLGSGQGWEYFRCRKGERYRAGYRSTRCGKGGNAAYLGRGGKLGQSNGTGR